MNQRMKVAVGVAVVVALAGLALYLARDVQQVDKTKQVAYIIQNGQRRGGTAAG